jgi:uncharacterized protein (DUF2236 family)
VPPGREVHAFHASRASGRDPQPFGPESLDWRYFGANRMFLIGPRPAVLQNMLAELGQALDPETYFWAHATFVEQVIYFADTFVKRLTRAEKERIYLESKTWYRRYGVSDRPMPADYNEFERYWNRMIDEIVVAHPTAKYGVGYVTKGFPCPKGVPAVLWRLIAPVFSPVAAFLTTGGMPPRTREMLGLPWSDRQERRYQRFAALWRSRPVNWIWDHLPMRLRYNKFAQSGYARG